MNLTNARTRVFSTFLLLSMVWCLPLLGSQTYHWRQDLITVDEDLPGVQFELIRGGDLSIASSVEFATRALSASPGLDYVETHGTLSFGPGATTAFTSVALINDGLAEPTKSFRLVLTNLPPGAIVGSPGSVQVNIKDNDPGFSLEGDGFTNPYQRTVQEYEWGVELYVLRGSDLPETVWVDYETRGLTATPGQDFVSSSGRLTFGPGEQSQTIRVEILQNSTHATAPKTFSIALKNPMPGTQLGSLTRAIISIVDDDVGPSISSNLNSFVVDEFEPSFRFQVLRGQWPAEGTLEVDYKTVEGSATSGVDYVPIQGRLVFGPGEVSKDLEVPILNDSLPEDAETFGIQLQQVPGYAAPAQKDPVVVTLRDNDQGFGFNYPSTSIESFRFRTVQVLVYRSQDSDTDQSVSYRTYDLSAVAGVDYRPISGRLTFKPGEQSQTLTVGVLKPVDSYTLGEFGIELFDPAGGQLSTDRHAITVTLYPKSDRQIEINGAVSVGSELGFVDIYRRGATSSAATLHVAVFPVLDPSGSGLPVAEGDVSFSPGQGEVRFTFPRDPSMNPTNGVPLQFPLQVTQVSGPPLLGVPADTYGYVEASPIGGFYVTRREGQRQDVLAGARNEEFLVRRSGTRLGSASVDYAVAPGVNLPQGVAGVDFMPTNGTLSFVEGEREKSIWMDFPEAPYPGAPKIGWFQIRLSNPRGDTPLAAYVGDNAPLARSYDFEILSSLAALGVPDLELKGPLQWVGPTWTSQGVPEIEGEVALELRRKSSLGQSASYQVEIQAAASGETLFFNSSVNPATPGLDFETASTRVTFAAGEASLPLPVRLHADREVEGFEYFKVRITPTGGAASGVPYTVTVLIHDTTPLPLQIRPLQRGEVTASELLKDEHSLDEASWLTAWAQGGPQGISTVMAIGADGRTSAGFKPITFDQPIWGWATDPPYNGITTAFTRGGIWVLYCTSEETGAHRLMRFLQNGQPDPGFAPVDLLLSLTEAWDPGTSRTVWPGSRILPVNDDAFLLIGPAVVNGRATPFGCRITASHQTLDLYPQDARQDESAGKRSVGILRHGDLSKAETYRWSLVGVSAIAGIDFDAASGEVHFDAGQSAAHIEITLVPRPGPMSDRELIIRCEEATGSAPVSDLFLTVVDVDPGILGAEPVAGSSSTVRVMLTGVLKADLSRRPFDLRRSSDLRDPYWTPPGSNIWGGPEWSSDLILSINQARAFIKIGPAE